MTREDLREILSMSGPIFIEQFAVAFMPTLVSMLVKSAGLAAVASVNLLESLNQLFQQVFLSIGVGVTVAVAQYRGRGDLDKTGEVASQALLLCTIVATALSVLSLLLRTPILALILADSEPLVYTYSNIYFTFCMLSYPFMAIYSVTASALRGSGFPRISLVATLINNGLYALFAFIAVVGLQAGILGIGISMLAARVLAAATGMYLLKRGNANMRINRLIPHRLSGKMLRPVILMSIPLCLENLLFSGGKMITQTYSVGFGTNAIAVNGISNNMFSLLMVPGTTANNAVVPIVGRYIGMRDPEGARAKGRQFLALTTVVAVFTSLLIFALTPALAAYYSEIPAVQQEIVKVVGVCCLVFPILWPAAFVTPNALRGAGDVKFTTSISIPSMMGMRVGIGYVLAIVLNLGVMGIWLGMYADWLARAIAFVWRFRGSRWLQNEII